MAMTVLTNIQNFLQPKKLAIAGVSRNTKKFGFTVFKELKGKGFEVFPINPNTEEIEDNKCYKSINDLPDDVKHLHIATKKDLTASLVQQAIDKGITSIWIQQGSDTPEAVKLANEAGINLIHKKCILMYAEPVKGIHGFHRFLTKVFGVYPS